MTRKGSGQVRLPGTPQPQAQDRIPAAPPRGPRPPRINPGPPYAEVEQTGRWSWHVRLLHGACRVDSAALLGSRARADRIAARRLRRYLRQEERSARSAHRVTS